MAQHREGVKGSGEETGIIRKAEHLEKIWEMPLDIEKQGAEQLQRDSPGRKDDIEMAEAM